MDNKEKVYMKRLANCSMDELRSMKELLVSRKGCYRYANMMLRCITTAMLIKAGLQTA